MHEKIVANVAIEVELDGAGNGWTDVSDDVRIGAYPINVEYGINGSGPLDRIAKTGTMSWAMDNSASDYALQGRYSPNHTNQRSGWELGVVVRLAITYVGTTYYKFRGTLISVIPDAGQRGRQAVVCNAVDWMDEAARAKIRGIAIQEDKRSDQLVTNIVTNSVVRQPAATSFATGQSTFDFALDNLLDRQTSVLRALADVTISELGYLYVKGDTTQGGTLTFEDRHTRPKAGAAKATFDNSMTRLDTIRSRSGIINRVHIVVHPRTVAGSASTLYELTSTESVPSVSPNTTIKIQALFTENTIKGYRIAGKTITTPVSGTDWIANTAANGSGSNISSDVAVSLSATAANAVEFQITNNATSTAYITTLQVRGIAVTDITDTVISTSDSDSETAYGSTDTRIDMRYESNTGEFTKEVGEWMLHIYKDPRYLIEALKISANKDHSHMVQALAREPGDKVAVAEEMTGIVEALGEGAITFFINAVALKIERGGIITAEWALAPSSQQNFWILDQEGASEIGISASMGFA